jgi:hypothetical protein
VTDSQPGMSTRPLAFGYWALGARDTRRDGDALGWALGELVKRVARSEGYCVARCFTDVRGVSESGLDAMSSALGRSEAVAVIVPDLSHLHHASCLADADLPVAARYLRARLIVAGVCAGVIVGPDLVRSAVGA